jgi:hypothetical protein
MRGIKILQTLEIGCKHELFRNVLKKLELGATREQEKKSDLSIYDVK